MERNRFFTLFIVSLSAFGFGFLMCSFFVNNVNEDKLEGCQEKYAKLLRFDDAMTKVEKRNCEYRVESLQEALIECKKGK